MPGVIKHIRWYTHVQYLVSHLTCHCTFHVQRSWRKPYISEEISYPLLLFFTANRHPPAFQLFPVSPPPFYFVHSHCHTLIISAFTPSGWVLNHFEGSCSLSEKKVSQPLVFIGGNQNQQKKVFISKRKLQQHTLILFKIKFVVSGDREDDNI